MRFKDWLEQVGGAVITPAFYKTNSGMPGIRSKWSMKDTEKEDAPATDADATFGFRSPTDKKRATERSAKAIDSYSKGVPTRDDRPDIIHK